MTRYLVHILPLLFLHTPTPLPMAAPIVVSYSLSERITMTRHSLWEYRRNNAVRYAAERWGVPLNIAMAVSHAENYSGDSTAVNKRSGAVGIFQIHPVNFGTLDHLCFGPGDMTNLKRNACYGALFLKGYKVKAGSWSQALRLYLGYKTNTPALLSYLDDVIDHMAGL